MRATAVKKKKSRNVMKKKLFKITWRGRKIMTRGSRKTEASNKIKQKSAVSVLNNLWRILEIFGFRSIFDVRLPIKLNDRLATPTRYISAARV